jgi:hypothetical protein
MERLIRRAQKWCAPRPWAVRLYCVIAVLTLPVAIIVHVVQEFSDDVVSFFKDCWTTFRTGKFD